MENVQKIQLFAVRYPEVGIRYVRDDHTPPDHRTLPLSRKLLPSLYRLLTEYPHYYNHQNLLIDTGRVIATAHFIITEAYTPRSERDGMLTYSLPGTIRPGEQPFVLKLPVKQAVQLYPKIIDGLISGLLAAQATSRAEYEIHKFLSHHRD